MQAKEQPMTAPNPPDGSVPVAQQPPRRLRRALVIVVVAVAAGLTGAFASNAFSQGFGPPWHGGPFMHGPFAQGPFDPARVEQHADRMVRHLAVEVDATPEQQERLRAIVRSAVKDLVPLREKLQDGRQRVRDLLTQPTIDRTAIEAFRTDRMALADQASRRIAQAIADAASVLTPEQRRTLASRIEQRRGFMRPWHRG
jgi:Spy/CpxP family protein refolding chaperone